MLPRFMLSLSLLLSTTMLFADVVAKKIMVISGIPGSGKSTVIGELKKRGVQALYLSYGTEMKKLAPTSMDRDSLRKDTAEHQHARANQAAHNIRKALADSSYELAIVDTHTLILGADGKYVEGLSNSVVAILQPKIVVFLKPESKEIHARREKDTSRRRDIQTIEEIEKHQQDCIAFLNNKFPGKAFVIANNDGGALAAAGEVFKLIPVQHFSKL